MLHEYFLEDFPNPHTSTISVKYTVLTFTIIWYLKRIIGVTFYFPHSKCFGEKGGVAFREPPRYCCRVFIAHVTRDGWGMLLDNDVMLTTEPRVCRYESFNSPLHPSGAGCMGRYCC